MAGYVVRDEQGNYKEYELDITGDGPYGSFFMILGLAKEELFSTKKLIELIEASIVREGEWITLPSDKNIRESPSIYGGISKLLSKGDKVEIIAREPGKDYVGGTWGKILHTEIDGIKSLDYKSKWIWIGK